MVVLISKVWFAKVSTEKFPLRLVPFMKAAQLHPSIGNGVSAEKEGASSSSVSWYARVRVVTRMSTSAVAG